MYKKFSFLFIFLFISLKQSFAEEHDFSFGAGLGSLYNGIGINLGLQRNESYLYGSVGCIGLSHSSGKSSYVNEDGETITEEDQDEWDGNCGVGLGALTRGWHNFNPGHAFGIFFGATHDETQEDREKNGIFGLSYHYFFSKNSVIGWNIGISPYWETRDSGGEFQLMWNLGYQY